MNVSEFSAELKVGTLITDSIDVFTVEQSHKMVVELFGPGSKIRRYTPAYQCPNYGAAWLRGQRRLQSSVLVFGSFVDNIC